MSAPWLKFFPSDWRADPSLRMCSIAARGLWIEMLCVMHEATPRGTLRVNGKTVSDRQLAILAGCQDVAGLLEELEDAGVFSREADGTIFSRRMMRDVEKAEQDKANGRKGGNPTLRAGVNPQLNGDDKAQKPEARSQIQTSLRSDQIEKETRERAEFSDWFCSWPSAASDDDDDAFKAWQELTDADRSEAKARSAAYVEAAKGGGRTAICSAAKYLRKHMWKRVRDKPPTPPPKSGASPEQSREQYIAAELARSERSFSR
jgi:hypothetical protein